MKRREAEIAPPTMVDQATELRRLVLRAAGDTVADAGPVPRLLVLSGGKGGVGVTTLAVNLAVMLSRQGARVVLVDADLYRADVATLCGVDERGNVADVLAARRDIHEVLQPGPSGVQVLPGLWAPGQPADYSETAQQRLLRQLRTLGRHADVVVLDVGNGGNEVVRRFWKAADDVLLVTTPDSMSVMDSYATIKRTATAEDGLTIRLIVNKAADQDVARDVNRRINVSCQRFLGFQVDGLGYLPADSCVDAAVSAGTPFVISTPDGAAATALKRMAAQLVTEKTGATSTSCPSRQDPIEANKSTNLTEPPVPFSPIDRKGPVCPARLT